MILRDLDDARERLKNFIAHYNFQRPHQGLEGMTPADRFFGVEGAVKEAIQRAVDKNALRLALGEAPRKPVYLVGQIDGQSVSVHGEGGKVVVQMPDGERKEIETRDLGINPQPKKEAKDEHDEESGDDEGSPVPGAPGGPRGPQGAPPAAGAQALEVRRAGEDAVSGAGTVGLGEPRGAGEGAPHGDGDPQDLAGQEHP